MSSVVIFNFDSIIFIINKINISYKINVYYQYRVNDFKNYF